MACLKLGGTIPPLLAKRWLENGCLLAKNADYCKFVNEWVWLANECVYCDSMCT